MIRRGQARARYSPERVSTLIFSPGSTNSGTCTTRPVSSVAGLRAPDTRSPCTPGSVSVTSELDRGGELGADDLAVVHVQDGGVAFLQVVDGAAEFDGLDVELVVGLVVHEHERAALAVEVLHLALVDDRERDLLVGAEGALEHRAAGDLLELGAHERAALARLDVLELDDRDQALGRQVERHAVLEVVGRDAQRTALTRSVPSGIR